MRITALLENTSACGLPVEHGLSLFVEIENGCRFLFDMGQTDGVSMYVCYTEDDSI